MKIYDIIFAIAAALGLYAIGMAKGTLEALISGIVIGVYVTRRLTSK